MASEQSYLAKAFDSYYCHHDREIHYRVRGTREILPGRPIVLGDSRVVNSPHVVVTITSTRCNHDNDNDDNDDNDYNNYNDYNDDNADSYYLKAPLMWRVEERLTERRKRKEATIFRKFILKLV